MKIFVNKTHGLGCCFFGGGRGRFVAMLMGGLLTGSAKE